MTSTAVERTGGRAEWLEARRQGIGGSDVAAIAGLDPWTTPLMLFHEKLGLVPDQEPTPAMERGRRLETVAADLYHERTARTIRRQPLRKHREHEYMIGNVDRQIVWSGIDEVLKTDVRRESGPGVLECKCPGLREYGRLQREGLKDYYILQMQHYLGVYGYKWGSFAILNTERWGFLTFDVEFDEQIWQQLVELEGRFWHDHILAKKPPIVPDNPLIKMPEYAGDLVHRTDAEWHTAVGFLREAKDLKTTAAQLEKEAKERIQGLMGGFGVAEGAALRAYWREMAGRKSFDKKALERAKPLDPTKLALALTDLGHTDLVKELELVNLDLDLKQFDKQGKSFPEFRTYFLTGELDGEEGSNGES